MIKMEDKLKEFLRNKTGKPIIAVCYRLEESNYKKNPGLANMRAKEAVQNRALRAGKSIEEINIETLELDGFVYVKAWMEAV